MNPTTIRRASPPFALLAVLLSLTPSVDAQRRQPQGQRGGARWATDGRHVEVGGKWFAPATWEEVTPIAAQEAAPAPDARAEFAKAIEAARGKPVSPDVLRGTREASTLPRQPIEHPGMRVTDDNAHGALVVDGELWTWTQGAAPKKVAEGLRGVRRFELAPDGGAVSYVDGFDLCVTKTGSGETTRVSTDGSENLFYGELDWVYQEEVYGRGDFKATWWSPSGDDLAFMRIDENGVDTFTVVDHTVKTLGIEHIKYPKSGTINPRATLHVVRARDGKRVAVDLSSYRPEDEILIVQVGWTPEADQVVFMVQNREQTWLDLAFADPTTGAPRRLLHEEQKDGWVNRPPMPRWLKDGTFIWESERTGFKHLYRYARDGKLVATISHGDWEVRDVLRVDEERGFVAFSGTTPSYAIGTHAYVATLDGKNLRQITDGRGNHSVSFNADGTMVIDQFSSMTNPGEQWLRAVDGSSARQLAKGEAPAGMNLPVWEQVKTRDGEWVDVTYTLPTGFDENKKYPVWIETYSGPDAATIRDGFRGPRGASDWYVLLQVNVRSASGRGLRYIKSCYRQFGVQELRDIEDAIDWLCKNPWADASRVGITGWSYGGFMTAFAMTHSDKFKCGIAGGGVYDWELYDTIYTERYMATPQHNAAGYAASSVVKAAANLRGELLIVHGTMDDNVHMQNAIQFIDALQKAGKQNFTFMLYPRARHGVGSPHLAALREKFMREHL